MALPKFNLSSPPAANPVPTLASVLANVQAKLPHIRVPMPQTPPAEPVETPSSNPEPIAPISPVHCTEVTTDARTDTAPFRRPSQTLHNQAENSAYGYLFVPTDAGEKWRREHIETRYPRLNKYLSTHRRVLLSPLARFQLFDTCPPRDCLVYCGSPESGVPGNDLWSECVGMPHGEFMGDLN